MTTKFYPNLGQVIPVSKIPGNIEVLEDTVQKILDKVFYEDLVAEKSITGDSAYYALTLVFLNRLAIEVPGISGLKIIFFPDELGESSKVKTSLYYKLSILKYTKDIDLKKFGQEPKEWFKLILKILDIDLSDLVDRVLKEFTSVDLVTAIGQLKDKINSENGLANPITINPDESTFEQIQSITKQLNDIDLDIFTQLYNDFLNIGSFEEVLAKLKRLFKSWIGEFDFEQIFLELFTPEFSMRVEEMAMGLEFPRNWLKPIYNKKDFPTLTGFNKGEVITNEKIHSMLKYNVGSVSLSSGEGFEFEGENTFDFTKSQIGDTGFTIGFDGMKLDLSRTKNIAEADADGRPVDFMGVYAENAVIGFPKTWGHDEGEEKSTAELFGKKILIGTGGFSGTIGMRAIDSKGGAEPLLKFAFGGKDDDGNPKGFAIELHTFSIDFQQNTIVGVDVRGRLSFPNIFCKDDAPSERAVVDIKFDWQDGDWKIVATPTLVKTGNTGTLADLKSSLTVSIPDLLRFGLIELVVGKQNDLFYLSISGILDITMEPGGMSMPSGVKIDKMKIWSDGTFELPKGGYLEFKDPIEIGDGSPMQLSVTGIHLGSDERMKGGVMRKYKYFGLDGGISLGDAGVDARCKGLKVYFSTDHFNNDLKFDFFIRIESINIDITIPGDDDGEMIARIAGFLAMKETATGATEYIGGVAIELPKVGIAASAGMRMTPSIPSFLIDIAVDISTGIPITPLPLSIFGFRGLFGSRYIATKNAAGVDEEGTWYDYYKAKVDPTYTEGINVAKFENGKGISIGAGLSLATGPDSGKTISMKLMVLLTPGLFYLEGGAKVMAERVKLSNPDPLPFSLAVSISKEAFQSTFGVNFLLDDKGSIIKLNGIIDKMFPFKNSSGWYINAGTKEKPITARVLSLFDCYAFLMINSQYIEFGSGFKLEFDYGVKCFGLTATVYCDKGAKLNFKTFKVGGFINVGGEAKLEIFCIGLGIKIDMGMSLSAPEPIIICGFLKATGYVKVLGKKKSKTLEYEVAWEIGNTVDVDGIKFLTEKGGSAINMNTKEVFDIYGENPKSSSSLPALLSDKDMLKYTVPLDSYIGFKFTKPVKHASGSSLNRIAFKNSKNWHELIPTQKGKEGQNSHKYIVEDVKIFAHDGTAWKPNYDIYNALVPLEGKNFIDSGVASTLKYGSWQLEGDQIDKLMLMATNPFQYVQHGVNPPIIEQMNLTVDKIFCGEDLIKHYCHTADELSVSEIKKNKALVYVDSGASLLTEKADVKIDYINTPFSLNKGFKFDKTKDLIVNFPVPANDIKLKLFTSGTVTAHFQELKNGQWENVKVDELRPTDLLVPVVYSNEEKAIGRVLLKSQEECDSTNGGNGNNGEGITCETNQTGISDLLAMLNGNATGNTLVTNDVNGGKAPKLVSTVTQNLPVGSTSCDLELNFVPSNLKTWDIKFKVSPTGFFHFYTVKIGSQNFSYRTSATVTLGNIGPSEQFVNILVNELNRDAHTLITASKVGTDVLRVVAKSDQIDTVEFLGKGKNIIATHGSNGGSLTTIDYNNIASFSGLKIDTTNAKEGAHYDFAVEATMDDSSKVNLTGSTNLFHLACCGGKFVQQYEQQVEDVKRHIETLKTELQELKSKHTHYEMLCSKFQESPCSDLSSEYCSLVPVYSEKITTLETEISTLQTWVDTHVGNIKSLLCEGTKHGNEGGGSGIQLICGSALLSVCWLKHVDHIHNVEIPEREDKIQNTQDAIAAIEQSIQPIWRPDLTYCVQLTIKDKTGRIRVQDSNVSNENDKRWYSNFMFRTRGPIGHFHRDHAFDHKELDSNGNFDPKFDGKFIPAFEKLRKIKKEDQFKLNGIKHYIDYGKSYPNADGDIINAKPLYYVNPKLYTFYTKNYLPQMFSGFKSWNAKPELATNDNYLEVFIKDPAEPLDSNERIELSSKFEENRRSMLDKDQVLFIDLLKKNPCLSVNAVAPKGTHHEVQIPRLEPSKLYTAVYNSVYKGDGAIVHQYNFQTSKYSGFDEHVKSHRIVDTKHKTEGDNFFEINLTNENVASAEQYDIAEVKAVAGGTLADTDPLVTNFMHPYDRLINGAMKLKSLEEPEHTEYNWVRETNPGSADENKIIGLLLRSPEPFNDPKVGETLLKSSIKVVDKDGNVLPDYEVKIVSKDGAKFYITNSGQNITANELSFKFDHITYTPQSGFIVTKQVTVKVDVPQYFTKLQEGDCGKIEVDLKDTISATKINNAFGEEAEEYSFNISAAGFDKTMVSKTNSLDLSLAALDFNKTYEVKVKGKLKGKDLKYGDVCNVSTKSLSFEFITSLPDYIYKGTTEKVNLALRFKDGSVHTSYTGSVKVKIDIGGTVTELLATITKGLGSIDLIPATAGVITLSLEDVATTGYTVTDTKTSKSIEPATKLVIPNVASTYPTAGAYLKVEAQSASGLVDEGFIGTLKYTLNGIETVAPVIKGVANLWIGLAESKVETLTVFKSSSSLTLPAAVQLKFVNNSAMKYQLSTSATLPATVSSNVVMDVKVLKTNGSVDDKFQHDVTIALTSGTGAGVVSITNGVGSATISTATAETVTVSMTDSEGTGINVADTLDIEFV